MKKVRKAVIPAAGLGTRFLPITKSTPKEMLPIVDKPTIQYIIEEIVASGIEEILIINGRNKESIINHFDRVPELEALLKAAGKTEALEQVEAITKMAKIFSVRQKEAKGLGHAVLCAKEFVGDEPFAVVLGDDIVYNDENPALKQMIEVYDTYGASVIGVQQVAPDQVNKYGIVSGDAVGERVYQVNDLVEKPAIGTAPSTMAILGRYIITPGIFEVLEHTGKGSGGEIQLTDGLKTLAAREKMFAYDFVGKRYDVGDKLGFLQATVEYGLRDNKLGADFKRYLETLFNDK
ncbi:UTP--glucose-1-phosphate uridylyltransferase GalU [Acetobacterium sp.]|jgi:UTP--glucose-1-phosphate uridylyltransferase|uniref:UTP--glucose-1-phosphate uridylyltransferase GalU n=1 Tax=Acetobacterium sp. TaxID=1872094 RepID=UPI000CAF898C|nr:UTP--glucose-1-phosphate uridylyltransferase GalU [Acetobacterium sp.]MDO9493576.1 UTP--glucose-1-phosphate uridylyltransferase GalU [Acetobacterium sp.]PKM71240.1 MAG: UTP--glucose-1-phosphate uridylyltransferase [Firmicutes bacterium HGW-Firmicutes-17]